MFNLRTIIISSCREFAVLVNCSYLFLVEIYYDEISKLIDGLNFEQILDNLEQKFTIKQGNLYFFLFYDTVEKIAPLFEPQRGPLLLNKYIYLKVFFEKFLTFADTHKPPETKSDLFLDSVYKYKFCV